MLCAVLVTFPSDTRIVHQAYLILATVVGAAIGHYVFSPDMDIEAVLAGASGGNKGMACH